MRLLWRNMVLCIALHIWGGCGVAMAQSQGDLEILRSVQFDSPREDRSEPYGLVEGKTTLSPLYHTVSGMWWVWQNAIAPEVAAPGGYTETNANYFKSLVGEYGLLKALFLYPDRVVRNTKVGRATTPANSTGLIEDNPKRYRQ